MAVNIDEGEPGTFKDRVLPRARSAPLHRGHADRRLGGGHRGDLRLPARRVPRLPRAAGGRAGQAAREPAGRRAADDRVATRRRRLHLRRRVGDDRIDRRQARAAAAASAVRRAGRPVRPARRWSTTSRRCTGCATCSKKARHGSRRRAATAARGCAASRSRAASRARRQAGAGRHHAARTDRRTLRRHGSMATRCTATCRAARRAASCRRRWPTCRLDFDTLAAARLLHRLGRGGGAVEPGHRRQRGAQHDALLQARVVRPVHAVPRRHRQVAHADRTAAVGRAAAGRAVAGDARCVDLRPGPGGAESGGLRDQVLPA